MRSIRPRKASRYLASKLFHNALGRTRECSVAVMGILSPHCAVAALCHRYYSCPLDESHLWEVNQLQSPVGWPAA